MYQNCIFQNLKYPLVYIALVEMRIIMSDSITKIEYTVPEEESGNRLDQFLTKKQPDISRSFLQNAIFAFPLSLPDLSLDTRERIVDCLGTFSEFLRYLAVIFSFQICV